MGDTPLSTYIAGLIKKGYDPEYVRTQLIKQGYPPAEVNQAIERARPKKGVNKLLLFGSLGSLIVIGLVVGGIFIFSGGPEPDIHFELQPESTSVNQNDVLAFNARLTNSIDEPTAVRLRYSVIAQGADRPLQVKQDSITVRTESLSPATIALASFTPGTYILAAEAVYEGKQERDEFTFTINPSDQPVRPTVELAECPAGCDDFNACTEDFCQEGRCVAVPITPCCGNNVCDEGESVLSCARDCRASAPPTSTSLISQARSVVLSSKQDAADLCNRIAFDLERDDCFSAMAEESSDPDFCGPILSVDRKDACYLTFALEGDQQICINIVDARLQATCFQYAQFSRLASEA